MKAPALETIDRAIDILRDRDAQVSLHRDGVTPLPYFSYEGDQLTSPQSEFYGIYALRNAFRGLFLAVNYFASAERLIVTDLHAPSVALSYTSSYHVLMSFLALHGRVYTDWRVKSLHEKVGSGKTVVAIWTSDRKWKFEPRPQSHEIRWRELVPIFSNRSYKIPNYFHRLFRYHWRGRYKNKLPWDEWAERFASGERVSRGEPYKIRDVLPEFLSTIARTRHRAMYEAFGSDPAVAEALTNRETFSRKGIDRKAKNYFVFASELFADVTDTLYGFIERKRVREEIRRLVFLGVTGPWMDSPHFDAVIHEEISDRLTGAMNWLIHGRIDGE